MPQLPYSCHGWGLSQQLPHGCNSLSSDQGESYVTTDTEPASLVSVSSLSGAHDQIFVTVSQLWFCWCRVPSLVRGWSVIYNCYWPLPAQLYIYYCLRYKIPPTWRVRSPHLYTAGVQWSSNAPGIGFTFFFYFFLFFLMFLSAMTLRATQTSLHTGGSLSCPHFLHRLTMDCMENTLSNSSFIVADNIFSTCVLMIQFY
jgi:hypothetical protein